jgi:hypothetical protein
VHYLPSSFICLPRTETFIPGMQHFKLFAQRHLKTYPQQSALRLPTLANNIPCTAKTLENTVHTLNSYETRVPSTDIASWSRKGLSASGPYERHHRHIHTRS